MKANEKVRSANFSLWSSMFQDQIANGMTIKDWCAQNNVPLHAYYYWKRIAKESYVDSIIPYIVPIVQPLPVLGENSLLPNATGKSCASCTTFAGNSCSKVSLSIGDTRIEIGASASNEVVLAIIKAVHYA